MTDYVALAELWERSVMATHVFLTEDDIKEIKDALVPVYFPEVDLYAVRADGRIAGFVGLSGEMIEMLFVDSDCRGCGYGSMLVGFAESMGANRVDVNEQNPAALGFYLSKGFRIIGRDPLDSAGRPFPILHLSL